MLSTSILWSRRRTTANVLNTPPNLTPLSLKKYDLIDIGPAIKSSQSSTTISSSSSILFTPTEMVGVLLGDNTTSRYFKHPLQILSNSSSEPNIVECTQNATKRFDFDSTSVLACLQQRSEFDVEIDMATLATEVALNTLDSDDEGELDEEMEMIGLEVPKLSMKSFRPRLRLLPYSPEVEEEIVLERQVQSNAVVKGETISILIHDEESNPPSSGFIDESQPVKKGRARMSQEKRRRLARRREREALMMGLPPRASSAPPSNTTFASVLEKGIGGSTPVKVKFVPENKQIKVNVKHCLPPRPLYHQAQPLHQANNKSPREQHFLLPDQVFMNSANTQPYRCISVNQ